MAPDALGAPSSPFRERPGSRGGDDGADGALGRGDASEGRLAAEGGEAAGDISVSERATIVLTKPAGSLLTVLYVCVVGFYSMYEIEVRSRGESS